MSGDHFYTTSAAERDVAAAGAYEAEGVVGHVFPGPEAGPVPWYRAWLPSNGDHFYTADAAEYDNAVNSYGYRAEGTAGYIFAAPGAGTTPLYRLWLPSNGDHFYTTSVAERDNAIKRFHYRDEGTTGHVFGGATGGAGALYRAYNPHNGDHFFTMDAAEHANAVASYGYLDEGVACYLPFAGASLRIPLFRCYKAHDHFYTTSQAERDSAINDLGYTSEGIACWVHGSGGGGTAELYRCYSPATGDHFYTMSQAEAQNAVAAFGYVAEGVACYIFPNAAVGTTPFFRLFEAFDCFVEVNLIAVSGDTWTSAQWTTFLNGLTGAAQIYRNVGIRMKLAGTFQIAAAQAGGYPTIDSDSEAEDLTEDWTVPNSACDVFGVPTYVGPVAGLSPVDGPCDKDAKGMNGSVVERMFPLNVIIAHEVGHYLGLDHNSATNNFMNPTVSGSTTIITGAQGSKMKKHCFIRQF
jgi:hypothetical protein